MPTSTIEKHAFQAEVQQVLDIVVNALYTDKDIFIRELVSNASDALEKLRHTQLTKERIHDDHLPLEINISTDDQAGTLTIQDFGIGMTHLELIENLGTIAHSGSKAFIKAMEKNGSASENLIGQFGVGFYSVFMVANSVEVYTHSWDPDAQGCLWKSDGTGEYTVELVEGQRRGCKIVIHLKEAYKEFSKPEKVKSVLQQYSSFVQFPIQLNADRVNKMEALWLKNKNEISEDQYKEFYKFQANAYDEPLYWLHFSADAPLAINALLYIPGENLERYGFGRVDPRVALYCRKILIDDAPKGLLPEWMRFLRGVVDSADLPLNISRESMQDSALIQKLNKVITRRFIKDLEALASKEPKKYQAFWQKFSHYIKEGITTDFSNKEQLSKLLRFESSKKPEGESISLQGYTLGMPEGQKDIYFIVGKSRSFIEASPYLEAFKARDLEVIYLYESIDEFVMTHLGQFQDKRLVSIEQAGIQLSDIRDEASKEKGLTSEELEAICKWMEATLKDQNVKQVTAGTRLVRSPVIALTTDSVMTANMRRLMKAMHPDEDASFAAQPVEVHLEINPRHTLIKNLATLRDRDASLAKEITQGLLDSALMSAGLLEEPQKMVERTFTLLEKLSK